MEDKHKHDWQVEEEYVSKGKNIIGVEVKCIMEKIYCKTGKEYSVRRKK